MINRLDSIRKFIQLALIICIFLFPQVKPTVKAQQENSNNFSHSVVSQYITTEDRKGILNLIFTTTNLVENDYLKNFYLNLPFKPTQIDTTKSETPIEVTILDPIDDKKIWGAQVNILKPVYGVNQEFKWNIQFTIDNFVLEYGTMNAIIIPTFRDSSELKISYKSELLVNKSYGNVAQYYNDATLSTEGEYNKLEFQKKENISNYLVILGEEQTYQFEIATNSKNKRIALPIYSASQILLFDDFPKIQIEPQTKVENGLAISNNSFLIDTTKIPINKDISGQLIVRKNQDTKYQKLFEKIENEAILKKYEIPKKLEEKEISEFVWDSVLFLNAKTSIKEVFTTSSSNISFVTSNEDTYNPLEINKLLREHLSSNGIESRGVIGLVNPVNTFDISGINGGLLPLHTWTEFWDGEKWVSVDPIWIKTSNGNNYINKNHYHHINFLYFTNYSEIRDLIDIIATSNFRLTNKKINNHTSNRDISMALFKDTNSKKQLNFILRNNSKQIIFIDKINPKFQKTNNTLAIIDDSILVTKYLFPNSTYRGVVEIEYNFLFSDVENNIIMDIVYSQPDSFIDKSKTNDKISFIHKINIKHNLPIYALNLYLVIILLAIIIYTSLKKTSLA